MMRLEAGDKQSISISVVRTLPDNDNCDIGLEDTVIFKVASDMNQPAGLYVTRRNNEYVAVAPTGIMMPFAGPELPLGWLLCDGSEISRIEYDTLFNTMGTTFGVGDDFTTFNLPDLSGILSIGLQGIGYIIKT